LELDNANSPLPKRKRKGIQKGITKEIL